MRRIDVVVVKFNLFGAEQYKFKPYYVPTWKAGFGLTDGGKQCRERCNEATGIYQAHHTR